MHFQVSIIGLKEELALMVQEKISKTHQTPSEVKDKKLKKQKLKKIEQVKFVNKLWSVKLVMWSNKQENIF